METLTFYRKMANSNIDLIKKYKSNYIKKLNYDEIADLYKKNNIDITADILRLKKFNQDKNIEISNIEIQENLYQNHNIIYISLIVIPVITLFLFYKK
jgi:parvulin-like peptidyl-prolyl isomerase